MPRIANRNAVPIWAKINSTFGWKSKARISRASDEPMTKLLLVEDDLELLDTIEDWLTRVDGHTVDSAMNGAQALERLKFYKYDVVVIDWGLPNVSGIEVCRQFRSEGGNTPILMLTARREVEEKLTGLDSGADDYLTKPFDLKELSGRVRALLRRSGSRYTETAHTSGDLVVDPARLQATKSGIDLKLSKHEFALLEFLMRHKGEIFTPEALLDRVWKSSSDSSPAAIRTMVKNLRKKIDSDGLPSIITNVRGAGYRFDGAQDA